MFFSRRGILPCLAFKAANCFYIRIKLKNPAITSGFTYYPASALPQTPGRSPRPARTARVPDRWWTGAVSGSCLRTARPCSAAIVWHERCLVFITGLHAIDVTEGGTSSSRGRIKSRNNNPADYLGLLSIHDSRFIDGVWCVGLIYETHRGREISVLYECRLNAQQGVTLFVFPEALLLWSPPLLGFIIWYFKLITRGPDCLSREWD